MKNCFCEKQYKHKSVSAKFDNVITNFLRCATKTTFLSLIGLLKMNTLLHGPSTQLENSLNRMKKEFKLFTDNFLNAKSDKALFFCLEQPIKIYFCAFKDNASYMAFLCLMWIPVLCESPIHLKKQWLDWKTLFSNIL